MFKKKIECKNCGDKIDKSFEFCPFCGNSIREQGRFESFEDFGLLGKEDSFQEAEIRLPLGFNALFNSLVKNLDNQFKELDKELGKEQKSNVNNNLSKNKFSKQGGISISISSFGNQPPKISVKSFGNVPEFNQQEEEIKKKYQGANSKEFAEKNVQKLSKLPRTEPLTNVRRLSNKVVYEIDLPGVISESDISIMQLENSIEIKAVGKDKAYFKLIPLDLPIKKHSLKNGKLVLELDSKE
jgi:HSP20 family molecular chaperone IbpA